MGRGTQQIFFQKRYPNSNRYIKRGSTSVIIRGMQLKTTITYHLTPVRMAMIKKTKDSKCWRGCGEKETIVPY